MIKLKLDKANTYIENFCRMFNRDFKTTRANIYAKIDPDVEMDVESFANYYYAESLLYLREIHIQNRIDTFNKNNY